MIFISVVSTPANSGATITTSPTGLYSTSLLNWLRTKSAVPLQKFTIRIVLEAMLSLSCLIPIFLISARIVAKPLALIAVALVLSTPAFFGHAFINPKDSLAASGFLWSLWLILYSFQILKPSM